MKPPPFSPRLLVDSSRASRAPTPRPGSLPTSPKTKTPRTPCTSPSTGPAAHTEPAVRDAEPSHWLPRDPGLLAALASPLRWHLAPPSPLHGSRSVPGYNASPWALSLLRQGLTHSSSFAGSPGQAPTSPGVKPPFTAVLQLLPQAQQREGPGKPHACSPSLNTYCFSKLMWKMMARLMELFFSSFN